jgi:DNA topoisomerase-1
MDHRCPRMPLALKIPPAWTDVRISHDPNAALLATGKDAKGRPQSIYSEAHAAKQAAVKFARIIELQSKFNDVLAQNEAARRDPKTRDVADCLNLIMRMGVRPGSDSDTGAEKKAYGATTLEGKHVVRTPEGMRLQFTGKKGVELDLPVTDDALAANLWARAQKAGQNGRLFGAVTDKSLLDHTHTMDGGGFKTKDMRTRLGTQTAADVVSSMPKPTDRKSYDKAVKTVAIAVSKVLGNTPKIALEAYISPTVFAPWQLA